MVSRRRTSGRRGIAAAALAVAAIAATLGLARAQSLQRLTLTAFTLSADTSHPRFEVPFHLIVRVRVRQRVVAIDNLDLPVLAELELLGDVRTVRASRTGSSYREVITVVAHHTGTIEIAPATLEAIDATDGQAKEFFSNSLRLTIGGGPIDALPGFRLWRSLGWAMLWLTITLAAAAMLAWLAFVMARRRPQPLPVAIVPEPARPIPTLDQRFADALTVLRASPTRATAVTVRAAIWRALGADAGGTLADAMRAPAAGPRAVRGCLAALERAAFTYDADLAAALEAACAALAACVAKGTP